MAQARPTTLTTSWGESGDLAAVNDSYNSTGFPIGQYPLRKQMNAALNRIDKTLKYALQSISDNSNINTTSVISIDNFYTETQSDSQNITLFAASSGADTVLIPYVIRVKNNNVTISVSGGGTIAGETSLTFNSGDYVVLFQNSTEWFLGS